MDSQASVLAGIQERVDGNGKTNVDISKITAQISHLQALLREQLESTTQAVATEEEVGSLLRITTWLLSIPMTLILSFPLSFRPTTTRLCKWHKNS